MKRLIVHQGKNASIKAVGSILATWSTLVQLVEKEVDSSYNEDLVWELTVNKGNGFWQAHCSLSLVFRTQMGTNLEGHIVYVDAPLTEVPEIYIYDDGTFAWHNAPSSPERSPFTIKGIVEAVITGKYRNFNYQSNIFPRL